MDAYGVNNELINLTERASMDSVCNSLDICLSTDLKILNGRMGDDAGIGCFTFMSALGSSLIDHVIASLELFSLIRDFCCP